MKLSVLLQHAYKLLSCPQNKSSQLTGVVYRDVCVWEENGSTVRHIQHHYFDFVLLCSHDWPEQQDTEIWRQGAAPSSRVCRPGQTQRRLYLLPHCIKPIIHHQGLFSATVNVLFTLLQNVVNGVSSTAQTAEIVNMFFSPVPTRGYIKKTADRRFNSKKPLPPGSAPC